MGFLNGKKESTNEEAQKVVENEEMLDDITEIVEKIFHNIVDRESFSYSRFATHMLYLFQRIHNGNTLQSDNESLYQEIVEEFPKLSECADMISTHMEEKWKCTISEEERLYIMLHVNRICAKEGV